MLKLRINPIVAKDLKIIRDYIAERKVNTLILHGSKNTLTGIVDVAMVGSMYSKGKFNDFIDSYGMVLMDECHHCGNGIVNRT